MSNFFDAYFSTIASATMDVDKDKLKRIASDIVTMRDSGGKLIIAGNGGSAAMASHVAVDFTKAGGIRAINFNEADLITCFANDYGYENWVAEALKAYSDPKDVVILISSSGMSENIVNAAVYCNQNNLTLHTVTGFSAENSLRKMGSENLWVDSTSYNVVEMTHHIWLLAILDFIIEQKC